MTTEPTTKTTTPAPRAITYRPIIFSGPMVRVILAGTKTQTRRVIKLRDPSETYSTFDDDGWPCSADEAGEWHRDPCRYGMAGDRLYVRENWRTVKRFDKLNASQIANWCIDAGYDSPWCPIEYQADGKRLNWDTSWGEFGRLRVARFMPRWLSRIDLENQDVRPERLHDITEADALIDGGWTYANCPIHKNPVKSYTELWDKINGKRASWASNPWVWRIELRRVEG